LGAGVVIRGEAFLANLRSPAPVPWLEIRANIPDFLSRRVHQRLMIQFRFKMSHYRISCRLGRKVCTMILRLLCVHAP